VAHDCNTNSLESRNWEYSSFRAALTKIHETIPSLPIKTRHGIMSLSSQLCGKCSYEDPGPGQPGYKSDSLFEKYLKQKGLGAWYSTCPASTSTRHWVQTPVPPQKEKKNTVINSLLGWNAVRILMECRRILRWIWNYGYKALFFSKIKENKWHNFRSSQN
jgi:hypothetical protein